MVFCCIVVGSGLKYCVVTGFKVPLPSSPLAFIPSLTLTPSLPHSLSGLLQHETYQQSGRFRSTDWRC